MANKSNKTMKKFIVLSASVFKDLIENGTIRFESAQIDVQRIQQPTVSQITQASPIPAAADKPQAKPLPRGKKPQNNTMQHCRQCEESFPFYAEMKKHYSLKHPEVPVQDRYTCPECPYSTNAHSIMKIHLQQHKKEQPHGCPYCPSRFTRLASRNFHVDTLHRGLEHKCPYCDYTTMEYSHMHFHIRGTHDTPLPFSCTQCQQRFELQGDLDYHFETHTRPFPCSRPRCLRRFTSEAAARQHEKVAHADNYYYSKRPKIDMPSLD